ncbi:MAG TPA: insulinase family protein [Kofleriaceae bacterium]|nr:insulinase family protein [Kofleriaceae bacterium]
MQSSHDRSRRWWFALLALVTAGAVAAGCSARSNVRFGSLTAAPRSLDYKPGIAWWTLPNKLKVAVMPDERVNLVSVDVRYLVGAADDPPGKTGLAHLVEHVMFARRIDPGGPKIGDELSAAGLQYNAYTNEDSTHYYTIGLAASLDRILAIEARRMAMGCDGLDQATVDHERAVVLEEVAQRGLARGLEPLYRELFGAAHAYGHTSGGHDVASLTLDDVCRFIEAHYAPARAILVVGGRIPATAVHGLTTQFGPIARVATETPMAVAPVAWTGQTSELEVDVNDPTVMVVMPASPWGSPDAIYEQLIDRLVEQRLWQLARQHDWITGVSVGHVGGGRGGGRSFQLELSDAKHADDAVAKIYQAMQDLPGRSDDDLVITLASELQSQLLDSFESIAARGSSCADFLQFTTHGQFQLRELTELQHLDLAQMRKLAWKMVPEVSRVIRLVPDRDHARRTPLDVIGAPVDRPVWHATVDVSEANRPLALPADPRPSKLVERRLANGLRVVMLADFRQPVFEARMVFPVGEASIAADQRGVATAAAAVLSHDFAHPLAPNEKQTVNWVLRIGAPVSWWIGEHTTFRVHGFSLFADCHLWRLYWLLTNGIYERQTVRRLREVVAHDARHHERHRAGEQALREALFGHDHPYARDTSVTAAINGAGELDKSDLEQFRDAYYRASGATLILVGNFDLEAMAKNVTELFGAWSAEPAPALAPVPPMHPAAGPTWIAAADADAAQIRVTFGFAATSPRATSAGARAVVTEMVRDRVEQVRSRLGASYGINAGYTMTAAGDTLKVDGFVDAARAGEAIRRLQAGLAGLRTGDAALAAHFVVARHAALARALGDPIRSGTAADRLESAVANGLPLHAGLDPADIAATTLDDARAMIAQDLQVSRMVVVLSGRSAETTAALAAAGISHYQQVIEKPVQSSR